MNKTLKRIIIVLVLLIVVLVVLKMKGVFGKDEGLKITAEKAQRRSITETVNATGKIYPEIEVKVSSDISGEIIDLLVNEGDTVKKGQVLARIYADLYASQRDQAAASVQQASAGVSNSQAQLGALKATLDQAAAAFNRQKQLLNDKVISQSEFEAAQQAYLSAQANYNAALQGIRANQAAVQSAQASLTRASKDVNRATIVSPMDGVVSLLAVEKGERVVGTAQMAGTEMMRIADLKSIEAQVEVGENDIPKVKIGDTALVTIDAYNNRKFKGVVYKIANPQTGSSSSTTTNATVTNYKVHIRLLQSSYQDLIRPGVFPFRPNMTASADIQTQTKVNVMSVPILAVTTRSEKGDAKDKAKKNGNATDEQENNTGTEADETVFVLQPDGTVKSLQVKTGIQDINYIEVTSGIADTLRVVSGPSDAVNKTLKDGAKVKVVSKDELTESFKKK